MTQAPPGTVEYYATDAVGPVRIVFDAQGQVLGRSDYLPFGETFRQSGTLPRQRFTGQERDGEAGMDYFNARAYPARVGRFNAPDPLFVGAAGDPQQWNRYAYARNNPLRFTDPTGAAAEAPNNRMPGSFCSAEHSIDQCGGVDAFWSQDFGGGGGGFGDSYADGLMQDVWDAACGSMPR